MVILGGCVFLMSEVALYERRKRFPSAVEVWGAGTWPVVCMKRGSVAPYGPIGTFMYG